MHIHIHNTPNGADPEITGEELAAAGITGHHITYGTSADAFLAQAQSIEVLVISPWSLKPLNLFAAPHLKLIQSTSAGVDALQPFDRIPPGVLLMNNRGTHAQKAGEFALMAILMLVNRMPHFYTQQRAQAWNRETCGIAARQRLTIVGLGGLGGAAAAQASRLGMAVTGIRNTAEPHPHCARTLPASALDEVLPETDILLLACPLTAATRNLLSAERIAKLPEGAGVINIGRGRLVDEPALFAALDSGQLGGAVLDVQWQEPLPPGHPAWNVKNLILTPHMSADDAVTYNASTLEIFRQNLEAFRKCETPPTCVDRVKGY
jgi:phosphoglycerate dehydrogenase-like enzyme